VAGPLLAAARDPVRGIVRLGAMGAGMWPRLDWPSHSRSRRAGCGHAGVWSPVHHTGQ
jgi:hypothetical protein